MRGAGGGKQDEFSRKLGYCPIKMSHLAEMRFERQFLPGAGHMCIIVKEWFTCGTRSAATNNAFIHPHSVKAPPSAFII